MPIQLPPDLESSVRSLVLAGGYASEDEVVEEAVRSFLDQKVVLVEQAGLGAIGSMRDAADELDEIVAEAMRMRRDPAWRQVDGE